MKCECCGNSDIETDKYMYQKEVRPIVFKDGTKVSTRTEAVNKMITGTTKG